MCFKIARMKFSSPVHFGELGIGIEETEEIIHSDTLFSSLCHAWASLYGKKDLEEMLDVFKNEPPFLLSSCFLYQNQTYFLPKPAVQPPGFEEARIREEYGKSIKKMNYLPAQVFKKWVKQEEITYETLKENYPDYADGFERDIIPRVALDRATSNSSIYHFGLVKFNKDAGLYCLIKVFKKDYEQKLESAFRLLGELGLGGERSSGYGRFEVSFPEVPDDLKGISQFEGDKYCLLSLFHPENGLDLKDASYGLIERRGWILSPYLKKQYKRKTVTMFSEGSVFSEPVKGHLVDVTPDIWDKEGIHPIYRYGFGFTVGVKGGG